METKSPSGRDKTAKRFRVAFSFAGERRDYVEKVAAILAEKFGEDRILFDSYHAAEFARTDLGTYLPKLYSEESDLVVPVLCPRYSAKRWCGWEWIHIHGLTAGETVNRVMPARFEFATADGLSPAAGFIDLDRMSPKQFAQLILKRLALIDKLQGSDPATVSMTAKPERSRMLSVRSTLVVLAAIALIAIFYMAYQPVTRSLGIGSTPAPTGGGAGKSVNGAASTVTADAVPFRIRVSPAGTDAKIKIVGVGPYRDGMAIPPGNYEVIAEAAGFKPFRGQFVSGDIELNEMKLEPVAPVRFSVLVSVEPSEAQIRIMNIRERYYPGIELPVGKYNLEAASLGYITKRWNVEVIDRPIATSIQLEADHASVEATTPVNSELSVKRKSTGPELQPLTEKEIIGRGIGASCGLYPMRFHTNLVGRDPTYLYWEYGDKAPTLWLRLDGQLHKIPMKESERSRPDYEPRQKADEILYTFSGSGIEGRLLTKYEGIGCEKAEMCEYFLFGGQLQLTSPVGKLDLGLYGSCGM